MEQNAVIAAAQAVNVALWAAAERAAKSSSWLGADRVRAAAMKDPAVKAALGDLRLAIRAEVTLCAKLAVEG